MVTVQTIIHNPCNLFLSFSSFFAFLSFPLFLFLDDGGIVFLTMIYHYNYNYIECTARYNATLMLSGSYQIISVGMYTTYLKMTFFQYKLTSTAKSIQSSFTTRYYQLIAICIYLIYELEELLS